MKCFGCGTELEVGDQYIKDTPSGFLGKDDGEFDGIIADIFGGSGGKVVFCADCTVEGGDYKFETVWGDEDESA